MIMAGGGKSRVSLIQRTGRGTRLQHDGFNRVLVVDFDDTSKFVNKHSEQRKEYLQWFKFNIYEDPNYIEQFIEELKNWRLQNV